MADPGSWCAAAPADSAAESRSPQRGEVVPATGDDTAGIGEEIRALGRQTSQTSQTGDDPARPGETADTPAASAEQAGSGRVPL